MNSQPNCDTHDGNSAPHSEVTLPFRNILAQAILHSANTTLDTLTPFALHLPKICFVRASSNETVGTIVSRVAPFVRGKPCPPYIELASISSGLSLCHVRFALLQVTGRSPWPLPTSIRPQARATRSPSSEEYPFAVPPRAQPAFPTHPHLHRPREAATSRLRMCEEPYRRRCNASRRGTGAIRRCCRALAR
jgi:hypothetical protein